MVQTTHCIRVFHFLMSKKYQVKSGRCALRRFNKKKLDRAWLAKFHTLFFHTLKIQAEKKSIDIYIYITILDNIQFSPS